ncbi:MAG: chloride channel protein [Betaproteobacteria bacterium]
MNRPVEIAPPRLADESPWYTEHAALFVTTLKWALLGAVAGFCVGWGTRAFLWSLTASTQLMDRLLSGTVRPYWLLPLSLPVCVWLIRTFAPTAKGHGTEAVIAAIHQRSGRVDWLVAPIKLLATVVTLAFGGSVGKEGPCAQIGAAITSLFADVLRLKDEDRRRLVICGVGAGFAAVFGTPISGALFGIEVLYLGRIEYPVLFPCLVAGIVAHLVCGVSPPVPGLHGDLSLLGHRTIVPIAIFFGAVFGLIALLLIETMRTLARLLERLSRRPYLVAAGGGLALAVFYAAAGEQYAGLGVPSIEAALEGTAKLFVLAFFYKILATAVTLETGGSGGIVTPLFFIGATSGLALGRAAGLEPGVIAAFGFVSVVAAAANTPIAAAVMGMELLPPQLGVYAALCAGTAFLFVGLRSVYACQTLGLSKSGGLDVPMDVAIGDISHAQVRLRKGSLTETLLDGLRLHRDKPPED